MGPEGKISEDFTLKLCFPFLVENGKLWKYVSTWHDCWPQEAVVAFQWDACSPTCHKPQHSLLNRQAPVLLDTPPPWAAHCVRSPEHQAPGPVCESSQPGKGNADDGPHLPNAFFRGYYPVREKQRLPQIKLKTNSFPWWVRREKAGGCAGVVGRLQISWNMKLHGRGWWSGLKPGSKHI